MYKVVCALDNTHEHCTSSILAFEKISTVNFYIRVIPLFLVYWSRQASYINIGNQTHFWHNAEFVFLTVSSLIDKQLTRNKLVRADINRTAKYEAITKKERKQERKK